MRTMGHLALWAGFFYGAYLSVARLELEPSPWRTVNWPLYLVALFISGCGVVLLRASARGRVTHDDKLRQDVATLAKSTALLRSAVKRMCHQRETITVFEVHHLIDKYLAPPLGDFAEARTSLIHSYGLEAYAGVMTDFAIAERLVNRAWSASADGYVDEVWTSLSSVSDHLDAVADALQRLAAGEARFPGADSPLK